MTIRGTFSTVAILALATGLLAGCMPTLTPVPMPSTSSTKTPTPTPTPTETAEAEPEEDEAAQAPTFVTCESLLSSSLSEFTSGGLSIVDEATTSTRLHNEGDPFALFFDTGGVVCIVSTGFEAYGIYSWGPIHDADWTKISNALFSEGWSEQVTDAGIQLTAPEPGPLSICYYRPNDYAGCASTLALLDEVFANAP
jgi:hypothetical protein